MKIFRHGFFLRQRPMRLRLRIAVGIFFLLLALCSGIWITVAQRSMRFFNASLDESLKANAELASRNVLLEQEEKAEQSAENEPPKPHPGGLPVTRIASMRYGQKGI